MKPKPILLVSHCMLNTAAKVRYPGSTRRPPDEAPRLTFLQYALEQGVQLIQLPCPEFTLYGPSRWGHTREQFDNPFFRAHCRRLLEPVVRQLQAYLDPREGMYYRVLGVVGIEGSPSCGVSRTCSGPWGGELSGRGDLFEAVGQVHSTPGMGVLMEELSELLAQAGIDLPMVGLDSRDIQPLYDLLNGTQEGRQS